MKKINKQLKNSFLKQKLIQICRFFGYEIIDQNSFEVPSLNKKLGENLSIMGKKSINIPLGEVKITRKVKSLSVYLRTCSKVNLWNQNKKRIFECSKSEYSIRSLFSILKSLSYAKKSLENVNLELIIIDDNSDKDFLEVLNSIIKKFDILVDGSDNFKTKFLLNDYGIKYKKILVLAAISKFDGHVFSFNFQNNKVPCLRCFYQTEPSNDILNCETEGILGTTASILGGIQANEVLRNILKLKNNLDGSILIINLLKLNFKKVAFSKKKKCICSK